MKKWESALLLPVVPSTALLACDLKLTEHTSLPEQNFAFKFQFGSCYSDVLDTFNSTFTKDLVSAPAITIPFQLSDKQLVSIYQKMMDIKFFNYPDVFSARDPIGIHQPAERYQIAVRNGIISKTVDWNDKFMAPEDTELNNLRSLFQIIIEMISANPEYIKLPQRKGGCG